MRFAGLFARLIGGSTVYQLSSCFPFPPLCVFFGRRAELLTFTT